MKKKIAFLVILVMLIAIIPCNISAAYSGIATNITIENTTATRASNEVIGRILGVIQVLGTTISIIALIIIGMRYMFSSLEEKAEMKGVIAYYIIGAILVLATTNVLSFVYNVIWNINI